MTKIDASNVLWFGLGVELTHMLVADGIAGKS